MIYKYGIIGCGNRPMFLHNLIKKKHKNCKLVCVYDNNSDAIKQLKDKSDDVIYTHDIDKFLEFDMQFVIIASINCFHYENFMQVYKKNVKIFCEKPIVVDIDHCNKLQQLSDVNDGSKAGAGFVLRYSPFYKKIKELIDSKLIGSINNITAEEHLHYGHGAFINQNWRRKKSLSGGHIVEKGIHIIDLINWYASSEPSSVVAMGTIKNWTNANSACGDILKNKYCDNKLFEKYKTYENINPYDETDRDIEDTIACIITYKNNLVASLNLTSYSPNSMRVFNIIGTLGSIEAKWENKYAYIRIILRGNGKKDKSYMPSEEYLYNFTDIGCHGNGDDNIIDSLVDFVSNNVPMMPCFKDALMANKIAILLEKSIINKSICKVDES